MGLQWYLYRGYVVVSSWTKGGEAMLHAKRVALITGANKGIGFEIARQLGVQGMIVLVGARDRERGEEAVRRLQSEGIEASVVHIDVTDRLRSSRRLPTLT